MGLQPAKPLKRPDSNLAAQATLFRSELKDKIERGTGANQGIDLNIGRSVIQGLELAARYRFAPDWTTSANYTYTDSEVTRTQLDTGDPAQSIANRKGDPEEEALSNVYHNIMEPRRLFVSLNVDF